MNNMIWEIKSTLIPKTEMNIGMYTSIYNEFETKEEDILNIICDYFQKRHSNKDEVSIYERINQEQLPYTLYQCYMLSHEEVNKEHTLSANALITKKINRLLSEQYERESYLNSINVLLEDLLNLVKSDLPLKTKRFDIKSFIKNIEFAYDLDHEYSRLIVRLESLIPLIVEELNYQSNNKTLLIYCYPESNLSPKEQIRFRNILEGLGVPIIVLTGSKHFIAHDLAHMNYIRNEKQLLTAEFIDHLVWDAPLNFEKHEIKRSLEKIIQLYQEVIELTPKISNYNLADIIVFEPIDIYVVVRYLKHAKQDFELDIHYDNLPIAVAKYIKMYDLKFNK
ncbi:hypothetical protein [Staphylococcus coagulans]|uniref:hypothetical protein n=1 Tax=Staphylococcus coagulans TaxID=74706 RepID=UPI0033651F8D